MTTKKTAEQKIFKKYLEGINQIVFGLELFLFLVLGWVFVVGGLGRPEWATYFWG
jgi:hypothetical protein